MCLYVRLHDHETSGPMDIQQFVGDPSERFRAAVDAALDGANEVRLRYLLDRATVSETSAWLDHGLTWSDGSIGDDEAHWRARLSALSDLRLGPEAELARVAPTLQAATDTGSTANSAWLDNATIGAALDLLVGDGGYLSPGTLLDLEAFVRTSVLHDHVFHLPNVAVDTDTLNERLGERVYLGLPLALGDDELGRSSPLSATLYSLFWQSSSWLQTRRPGQGPADELWQR